MRPPPIRARARALVLVLALLVIVLSVACATSPEADPGGRLRVATWNVHRLFDANCDTGRCAPGDYEALPSPTELAQGLDRIARAIEALDADVVLLQEIESADLLDSLADRMGGRYPHRVFAERGRRASLDVGILSALPVVDVREHGGVPLHRPDGSPTSFARDPLEIRLRDEGEEWVFFNVHLKSKLGDDPGRRLAEATRLGELAREAAIRHPGARLIVGGDLNDVPGSPPLEALGESGGLRRVGELLPRGLDATHAYGGHLEAIDHLFVPRVEYEGLSDADIETFGSPTEGYAGSDHAALLLGLPRSADR